MLWDVLSLKQREAMDASRLERLLSASGYEEAKRTLSEIGWSSAEEADYEQMALDRVAQASTLVRSLSTDEKVTDCFLLKYDIANLKMLLKARCLGISAELSVPERHPSCGDAPSRGCRSRL